MSADADLSPPAVARLIGELIDQLGLEDVTLVGNDTGGALCQMLAASGPKRLGRLVLTNCDAYENFLPLAFRYLQLTARIPGGVATLAQTMRPRLMRRAPIAYGWLSATRIPDELLDEWVQPLLSDAEIRRDAAKLLRGIDKSQTMEAAEALRSFEKQALIIWGERDRFFPIEDGRRLCAAIPECRFERIPGARTFVSLDAPERVAELVGGFAAAG